MDRNLAVWAIEHAYQLSLSARRAWIEIWSAVLTELLILSLSARRAWIEIPTRRAWRSIAAVALRKESVDRNPCIGQPLDCREVALRKESVDRNPALRDSANDVSASLSARRAWIEMTSAPNSASKSRSLSARRAWIEIRSGLCTLLASLVALRKESVDRNGVHALGFQQIPVALRKESVDRNRAVTVPDNGLAKSLSARRAWIEMRYRPAVTSPRPCRSPQGERG